MFNYHFEPYTVGIFKSKTSRLIDLYVVKLSKRAGRRRLGSEQAYGDRLLSYGMAADHHPIHTVCLIVSGVGIALPHNANLACIARTCHTKVPAYCGTVLQVVEVKAASRAAPKVAVGAPGLQNGFLTEQNDQTGKLKILRRGKLNRCADVKITLRRGSGQDVGWQSV